MKKTTLLFVIALLGFPILTQTALMETELSFKIRNARGVYSFGTYHNGVGQTNLANGNLTLKRTILTRPGRAGLDLELAMYYNSKIWDRNANGMYVKDTGSKVGLGWYLGFPKLVQGASSYSMIFPDGSSHEIQQQNDGIWKSVDSTYIIYDPSISLATFKGGRKLHFGRVVGNTRYMTIMKDTNGNMIKASYASEGNLSYIMDTVGINGDKPAARFYYDSNGYLDYIQSFGMPHTTIRFSYQTADLYSSSRFSLPMQIPSGEKQLVSITTEMSDRNLIERFTYINGLGELGNVEKGTYMITSEEDRYDSITQYQYGTRSFADSTHTSVEERVVTNIAEYFGTTGYNTSLSYALDGNRTNPSQTTLTDIRGVTKYNFFSSLYPAKAWTDGLISSVQRKDSSQTTTYRTESTEWEQDMAVSFKVNPRPFRQTTTLDDGKTCKKEISYATDGTGNIKRIDEYKFGNVEILRSKTIDYLHESNPAYTEKKLNNLPTSISIRDGEDTEVARTDYSYDEYSMWTFYKWPYQYGTGPGGSYDMAYSNDNIMVRGNLTSVKRKYLEEDRFITTTYKYDVMGNVIYVIDPYNNASRKEYFHGFKFAYLTKDVNALGHVTEYSYSGYQARRPDGSVEFEYLSGELFNIYHPYPSTTAFYYDETSRITSRYTTNHGTSDISYDDLGDEDYGSVTTAMLSSATRYDMQSPTGVQIESKIDDPVTDIRSTVSYNNPWNQPSSVSFPFRDGSSSTNATYTYDPMGRVSTQVVPGVGTTSYLYIGNTVTITNPENKKKKYTYNEFGQVVQVDEQDENGNLTIPTIYTYNTLGKLIEILQVGQGGMPSQTRTFTYDSLDRMTSETHPEGGMTAFTYDDKGNAITQTDARGVVASATYDHLNRRTGISYSDGTPSVTFVYDETSSSLLGTISYGKGRMTSAWTSDGIGYSWSYNAIGRVVQQKASIDGIQYLLDFNYTDPNDPNIKRSLQSITYPDGVMVRYDRDLRERATKIYSDPAHPFAQYSYNSQSSAVSNVLLGDSIEDYYVYSDIGRLAEKHINKPGPAFGQSEWYYTYNAGSQISRIEEHIHQATSTYARYEYSYDNRQRLTTATHKTGSNQFSWNPVDQIDSFSYDQFNSMLSNQLQFPSNPSLNAETTFDVNPLDNRLNGYVDNQGAILTDYDPAGNMITEGTRSYTYDGEGRLSTFGGNAGIYRYDAFGRRVKKTYLYLSQSGTVSGNIKSIYGPGNELLVDYKTETGPSGSNNSRTDYVVNGGETIARRIFPEGGTESVEYLHRNHLGQVVDAVNYSFGYGTSSMYAQPFGSGGNDQFSGHKDDPESGLHYNIARSYYSPMARWTSPDPLTANVFDPQSLNKYTYVRNDPVNMIDPDGRMAQFKRAPNDGGGEILFFEAPKSWAALQAWDATIETTRYDIQVRNQAIQESRGMISSIVDAVVIPDGEMTVVSARVLNDISEITPFTDEPDQGSRQTNSGSEQSIGRAILDCTAQHYGLTAAAAAASTLGIPVPKSLLGLGRGLEGASNYMSMASAVEWKLFGNEGPRLGTALFGTTRVFGIIGRAAPIISLGLFAYDAWAIGSCVNQAVNQEEGD